MKLAISNIAWTEEEDSGMYDMLQQYGFDGVEIAPTRIFREQPYAHTQEAALYAANLKETYHLAIPSMQSVWFGQTDNIFDGQEARERLLAYTKQAIVFAEAIQCKNLVFGCPRNRSMPEPLTEAERMRYYEQAVDFFYQIAVFAKAHHTVLAMEANPPIYHTNFMNATGQVYELVRTVNHDGFCINLDTGTMIHNEETVKSIDLEHMIPFINHVHISEPGLLPIQGRELHTQLKDVLQDADYQKFVSIEMGKQEKRKTIEECIQYVVRLMRG